MGTVHFVNALNEGAHITLICREISAVIQKLVYVQEFDQNGIPK